MLAFFNLCYSPVLPSPFCICACGHVAVRTDKQAKTLPFGAQKMCSREGRPSFSRPLVPVPSHCAAAALPISVPEAASSHPVLPQGPRATSCLGRWWHRVGAPVAGRLLWHRLESDTARLGVLLPALAG